WTHDELLHKWEDACAEPDGLGRLGYALLDDVRRLPFTNPHRLAVEFPGRWVCWQHALHEYVEGEARTCYVRHHGHALQRLIRAHVNGWFDRVHGLMHRKWLLHGGERPSRADVTCGLVAEVLAELKALHGVPDSFPLPCLLPSGEPVDLLPVANGLLDVRARVLRPHTPDYFSLACLPYPFDPAATEPRPDAALAACFA